METNIILHPGEVLKEELKARNIGVCKFAMSINMYPSHFSYLLKGKKNITTKIALKLEKELKGISAEFWLKLQMKYDLQIAREKSINF